MKPEKLNEFLTEGERPDFSEIIDSDIIRQYCLLNFSAPLAQLDRASGYEPEGREFESLRAHHFSSSFSLI